MEVNCTYYDKPSNTYVYYNYTCTTNYFPKCANGIYYQMDSQCDSFVEKVAEYCTNIHNLEDGMGQLVPADFGVVDNGFCFNDFNNQTVKLYYNNPIQVLIQIEDITNNIQFIECIQYVSNNGTYTRLSDSDCKAYSISQKYINSSNPKFSKQLFLIFFLFISVNLLLNF